MECPPPYWEVVDAFDRYGGHFAIGIEREACAGEEPTQPSLRTIMGAGRAASASAEVADQSG